jgi:lysophospholipid acyltransferase (LPLAT)-like uncharacterized protein
MENLIMASLQAQTPQYQVDSVDDIFGALYRVWHQHEFLGSFYQNHEGWVVQLLSGEKGILADTEEEAAKALISLHQK